jgi:hypothetical protein
MTTLLSTTVRASAGWPGGTASLVRSLGFSTTRDETPFFWQKLSRHIPYSWRVLSDKSFAAFGDAVAACLFGCYNWHTLKM